LLAVGRDPEGFFAHFAVLLDGNARGAALETPYEHSLEAASGRQQLPQFLAPVTVLIGNSTWLDHAKREWLPVPQLRR
jgi:hypothetical protein